MNEHMIPWSLCPGHQWELDKSDYDGKPGYSQVNCELCGMPGERDDSSGEVYYPAT